jgi:hypothetical protein
VPTETLITGLIVDSAPAREEQAHAQWQAMLDAKVAEVRSGRAAATAPAEDEGVGSIMTTGLETRGSARRSGARGHPDQTR